MWYIYVVVCFDNSLYCGITTNLERRLKQHNGEIKGGAKYTRGRRPCQYVYTKKAANRSAASKEECKFKKLSRKNKLIFLLKNSNYEPISGEGVSSEDSSPAGTGISSQSSPSSSDSGSQAGSASGCGSSHPSPA